MDTSLLVVGVFTIGYAQNLVGEVLHNFVHGLVFNEYACIEVNPIRLALIETGVGADLHGWNECAEWCATSCGEEYELATCGCKSCSSYEVIARS